MIFGETGIGKKNGPNINNDRVVPFSNKRYNIEEQVVIKDVLAKKPNIKERIASRLAAKLQVEKKPIFSKIKVSVCSTATETKPKLDKVVSAASKLAASKGKLTNITVTVPAKNKTKPIDLLTAEEEQDVSKYLSEILSTPITKKKKSKTRLATLAGESTGKDLTKEQKQEQEELEIDNLRKKLHAKFSAVAEEEGVAMVFDVDAALSKLENTSSPKKKKKRKQDYSKILQKEKAIDTIDVDTETKSLVLKDEKTYVEIDLPKKPKKKKRRIIAQRKLGTQYVSMVPNSVPDKLDAESLASNVVDIPEKEIVEFRKSTKLLTRKYIDFMRRDILPHLIALDSAIDYTQALMQDGLAREDLTTDDSLLITLRWMLHRKATEFFGETLNCKMSGDHFDQVISELYKTDLLKSTNYSSETVGVIRKSEKSRLGIVSKKSNRNLDSGARRNDEEK